MDTNVFVYAVDRAEPEKQARALEVLASLGSSGLGAISPQVIGEFMRAACSRVPVPLSPEQAERFALDCVGAFETLPVDLRVVREAVRCWRRYSILYRDAQLWATARIAGVDLIVTEDRPAPEIEGVRYTDPFSLSELG